MKPFRLTLHEIIEGSDPVAAAAGSKEKLIDYLSKCPICGSKVVDTQSVNFFSQTTVETTKCKKCNVRVREICHALQ